MSAVDPSGYASRTDRRVAALERDRCNVVELKAGGGVLSRIEANLVKITGAHPTLADLYIGDLYGNGSTVAATATGVTVRIPGIAAGIADPSYGTWADLPACGAIRTVALDGTVVYETVGDLILR
jgi:hypothetical protein